MYFVASYIFKIFFHLFYKIKIVGKFPKIKGGAIIAANHLSFFDGPLVSSVCAPNDIHFLVRKHLFSLSILRWLLPKLNCMPLDQNNVDVIRKVIKIVNEGKKVVIFPEGLRSFDGKLQKIKNGIGVIAAKTQKPIIPIFISGTYKIWNRHSKYPKLRGKIVCTIGDIIYCKKFAEKNYKERKYSIIEAIQSSLQTLEKRSENL